MNKLAIITISLLSICGYSYADDSQANKEKAVEMTMTVRADRDLKDAVVREAREDAKALVEKYEEVCGADNVEVSVDRSKKDSSIKRSADTEQTKSCSRCSCSCSNCTSCSNCSCCRSTDLEKSDDSEKQMVAEDAATIDRCACDKQKSEDIEE